MRIAARPSRAAFTLLEVILAFSVAIILLAGLYVSFNIHMNSTDLGRGLADEANQARGIFNQVTADIAANMAPLDTRYNTVINYPPGYSGSAGSSGTPTPIGAAALAVANGATTTTPSTTSSSNSSSSTPPVPAGTPYTYNLMVQGSSTSMTVYTLAVPKAEVDAIKLNPDNPYPLPLTDLRRVTYWLVDGKGLARQEIQMVTDINSINTMPPSVDDNDPNTTYFPGKIKSIQFQYFDGNTWQDSWDGTVLSTVDNMTPVGPPMAIAVTLVMTRPGMNAGDRTFRNVVAIQMANNANPILTSTLSSGSTTPNSTTTAP